MGVHVLATIEQSGAVRAEDRPTGTAPAAPGEADTAQLRAAERLGLFPYSDAADGDSVKGHAA
jgi:hypothetical protein